ncbi:hypothetical protein HPB52_005334 [Rhipicephalus sanguineus]|uniref:Uncharacterized protein n=1 Tax=Rhipicephalus sanguineus TaxID=34632 RepID=A0A9D4PT01_RHISA|nr:hypothetical protein HPB52_005334 [Rhipicephalus sanguineus]
MSEHSSLPEVLLDCRMLQVQSQCKRDPVRLTARAQHNDVPPNRMVGWSCVFIAFGMCLFIGGGLMLVLSLTVETHMESLSDRYNMHTTIQGVAIFCLGIAFILAAFIKRYYHGHA